MRPALQRELEPGRFLCSSRFLPETPTMFGNFFQLLRKFAGSLSFKLSFYAGLIMFVALLAFAYHSIISQERSLSERIIQAAVKDSEVIKAAVWYGMMTNDREVIREIVKAIGRRGGFEEVGIYDGKGMLRYSSRSEGAGRERQEEADQLLQDIATNASIRHKISDDRDWIRVINPIANGRSCTAAACHAHPESEKVLGALAIRMSLAGGKEEIYRNARNTVVMAFLLFLAISSVIGLAVIFFVNPSLRRLQDRTTKMARGEYLPETASAGSDEIAELSRSFDEMSRQVNERTTFLAERRKFWRSLFEEVPCYLTVVSRDYKIVRANKAFREQFGDQVGKNCFVGYKGLDSRCPECPVAKTFADGLSHQSEEHWKLNGQDAYVIVTTGPVFDDGGNIAEVLEMSVDVTRLKQLQIELDKKQREYKQLFENVPCYLTVVDRDFNIVQANRVFHQDFGQNVGRKCFRVYKKRESKCDNCPVEQTFADGLPHNSEEVWRRNGQETNIVVNTAPLTDEAGKILAVMEMSTNVTEVKRLQSELALLGETVAGMSHTIKNILSGLQGGVYVVDSGLKRQKADRVEQGWAMVKNNVERISDLVQGILYASRERKPEYKECDPGEILSDVCDLYEAKAKAGGVALTRRFDREMRHCLLDPVGIHTALANLLSNAVEACRAGSDDTRHITVAGRVEGERLIMQVADDGTGMPEEVKEKLFGRFYSTKGAKGTGLGLVITKKIIEEHEGSIIVESEPGRGTNFTIEIPLRPPTPVLRTAV